MSTAKELLTERRNSTDRIARMLAGTGLNSDTRDSLAKLIYGLDPETKAALADAIASRRAASTPGSHEDGGKAPLVDLADEAFLEAFRARQLAPIEAVPTPLPTWNRCCKDDGGKVGIARGWFIAIGGNTKSGKSLLALNVADYAIAAGLAVGFVSLEMSVEQLTARFLAICSGVPVAQLEKGAEFSSAALDRAWGFLRERYDIGTERELRQTMLVNRNVLANPEAVWKCMKTQYDEGCRFFVVDYLQLVSAGTEDDLYKQVFAIANALRLFKDEYQVSILGLSQYNRATSADYTKSPVPQSLHGGSIENGVDQVLLLDHSRYAKDDMNPHLARTWLRLAANRHGDAGDIPVLWDYTTLRIREGMPDEESAWPQHSIGGKR